MTEQAFWDGIFSGLQPSQVRYDLWLEPFHEELNKSADLAILDLGCGAGNNALFLSERGYRVLACDLSEAALSKVREVAPSAETRRIRLPEPLPFDDESFQIVVADLSLHYFSWNDTIQIIADIRRILRPGGMLLCRVNSVHDVEYGSGKGELLEPHYYEWEGKRKRFFDREQLEKLFKEGFSAELQEQTMNRYDKPKAVWTAAARKM
ncbi:class I SAM-dependent methyltransferase [Paenibacillus filicis]|uniref:Class I SAM-dependent methyltransferase n=1 Tax=Paenibacillus gyeongsangnamensis TaxID=3388067 RepID=A0ABT4QG78_9BACL|nr:class I SAM-dependent methyltransferase [Paenibacillus filicis]MCZ8515866.1 class I SAM-dependent methyltransferase [Paenibacillus filicis]